MDIDVRPEAAKRNPTPLSGAAFGVKQYLLRIKRHFVDVLDGVDRLPSGASDLPIAAERRSLLYRETDSAERYLELGKVQNLRLAVRELNGVVVPACTTISFWKQVGRCTRRRGFVAGRQIQEGCLMPAIGGGICQLSNALYQAALEAELEVVERHPHSRRIAGMETTKDATVAWNYIDLRFRSEHAFAIEAFLTATELVVRIRGAKRPMRRELRLIDPRKEAASCATCGQSGCHHWHEVERSEVVETSAWLIDQWQPEFAQIEVGNAELFRPMDGKRWRRPAYNCPTERFCAVHQTTMLAVRQSRRRRSLAEQGALRQQALLKDAMELAEAYARSLSYEIRHLVVSQTLLPHLWQSGALGGRTFDVPMSRLPMDELQKKLDAAASNSPERKLLSDFRAPAAIVRAEREGLQASSRQYTCHQGVADAVPSPTLLNWPDQKPLAWRRGSAIVFPGPTAARKGAFEVREAARRLDLEVLLLGSELEGDGFWDGVRTRRVLKTDNWLDGVFAVVQPAVLEDRPIALLKALASGCPVVTTSAAGLQPRDDLYAVSVGDAEALTRVLEKLNGSSARPKGP